MPNLRNQPEVNIQPGALEKIKHKLLAFFDESNKKAEKILSLEGK